jgi:hypothetical protein
LHTVPPSIQNLNSLSGSEAFLQSTLLDLDKSHAAVSKKTAGGSGEAVSLLIGDWPEPLRLTLGVSIRKKLHSLNERQQSQS